MAKANMSLKKNPIPTQDPLIRSKNFFEVATGYSEEVATKILSEEEVTAIADMKMGTASATAWGCDLTYDYVKINADYRS